MVMMIIQLKPRRIRKVTLLDPKDEGTRFFNTSGIGGTVSSTPSLRA